jgi:hypothetical protein
MIEKFSKYFMDSTQAGSAVNATPAFIDAFPERFGEVRRYSDVIAPMSLNTVTSIRSYPGRLFGWIPLPYWLSILIAWELVFVADYLLGRVVEGGNDHLIEFGCLIVFFALACCTIVYCSKVLIGLYEDIKLFIEDDLDVVTGWYQGQLRLSYEGIIPVAFGLVFALLEFFTVGPFIHRFTPADSALYTFRIVYEFIGFFFLGLGVWALLVVARIPILLTRHKIKVSLTQVSGRGLQGLGSSFFRMSLSIIITFLPLVVAAIVSSLSENTFILAWLAGGLTLIFGFFLLPQIGVHRIMAAEKTQRLSSFTHHLEEAMERSLKDPSSENMKRLKELFDLQGHLKDMNEWPFNINTLWQLITALLIPIALTVLQIFF